MLLSGCSFLGLHKKYNKTNKSIVRSAASLTAALSLTPEEHAVGTPLEDAQQLLPQPLYVNQMLSRVLLHMDMLVQVAVVKQPVDLRSGLVSKPSCSLANRH